MRPIVDVEGPPDTGTPLPPAVHGGGIDGASGRSHRNNQSREETMNMPSSSTQSFGQPAGNVADDAASAADNAIQGTARAVDDAADRLSGKVEDLRGQATPLINRVTSQAQAAARRGMDAAREGAQQLREKAMSATDSTVAYVKDEPVKSMLIAAATGALLMGIVTLIARSSRDD
jgi:ElaB/YqjD/DUF883 family membrane-anchored ribosome-binding protein